MPKNLSDVSEPLNVLYYGDGGMAKTSNLAAMARLGKVVLVNAESGIKASALKRLFGPDFPIDNIEIYPDPEKGETLTFDGLENEWLRVREALIETPGVYAGFGWDSLTEIHKALLDDIVRRAVLKADRLGKDRSPHFIALEDYGVMTEQVRNLVRKFRDLPCHFALTALQRRDQDGDGSVVYNPQVTPKLQNDVIGWMDMVCHCSFRTVDGEDEYLGLFRPHSKFRGKDRLNVMPKWLVNPQFDRLVAYNNGELTVETDPVMIAARERQERVVERVVEAETTATVPA